MNLYQRESAASQGLWDAAERLGSSVERMIAIQAESYPSDWDAADKREMAVRHLFPKSGKPS